MSNLIANELRNLDKEADPDHDLLWLYGSLHPDSLPLLFSRLSACPTLKNREPHAVMLLGRQDGELRTLGYRYWKSVSFTQLNSLFLEDHGRQRLDATYENLARHCGRKNCTVLLHNSLAPHIADDEVPARLTALLDLPPTLAGDWDQPAFPLSGPGLDMAHAVFNFPFSFREKSVWDRNAFYRILCRVEYEEGYEPVTFLPHAHAHTLLETCAPGNSRLAEILGKETLFASPHSLEGLPDAPSSLPEMSPGQCRAFVKALSPEWRQALLRHFRDLPRPLHSTERILAVELEARRKCVSVHSPFAWPRPVPSIVVLTLCRNQAPFIKQCMESVTEQRCKLPFEHIIVDDNSDDDSASIIDNYASRHAHVRPVYLSAQSAHGENVRSLFSLCQSTYAAICDGDDYFTDPLKLQTQADFLDAHKDCGLCFHVVRVTYENQPERERLYPPVEELPRGIRPFYYLSDLIKCNLIQTNSVMYRWRFKSGLPDWFRADLMPGDWYWHLLHAETGKIGFINKIMSVYRRHEKGVYYLSEIDRLKHRATVGLKEIEVYDVINKHFNRKYESILLDLVNGVFADCLLYDTRRAEKESAEPVLNKLCDAYPDFARHFLASLKVVSNSAHSQQTIR
ncbi:MAG: glycosyltransferase family 2 protein [Desulfovibrio sp.]|nr:glycosyltransferase family 2 protein [Desulfovibrio sp.]